MQIVHAIVGVCWVTVQARLTETQIMLRFEHLAQARETGPGRQVISLRRVCLAQARIRVC